ncbi:MAG: LrgB family protein [Pseudoalteromonas sp.]
MNNILWWLTPILCALLFILLRIINSKTSNSFLKVFTNPVFLSITLIAFILLSFDLPYTQFNQHSELLRWLLEPAIVALALPLYQQFKQVRSQFSLMFVCCSLGVINATFIAVLLSALFSVPSELAASTAALSVTTPITLLVTDALGGIPSLGAAMVIFIGLLGALFGTLLLKAVGIFNHQAQGVAIGTACHAIGTAAVLSEHPRIGAFASVAMALCALLSALIVPLLYPILRQALL